MAFRTIEARYPGTCRRCGGAIHAGDRIRYGGRGRTYHLKADCENATVDPGDRLRAEHEAQRRAHPGSVVATFASGHSVYQNARGRCEDAPCCGCCTF